MTQLLRGKYIKLINYWFSVTQEKVWFFHLNALFLRAAAKKRERALFVLMKLKDNTYPTTINRPSRPGIKDETVSPRRAFLRAAFNAYASRL
jgi:hypothetical protein